MTVVPRNSPRRSGIFPVTNTLRVGAPNLTAVTMDTVFAEAAALVEGHADGGAEEFRLSLEDVKFIDPYGLVGLWCVLRYLKRRHHAVVVLPPTDLDLQGYLQRMNFPAVTAPMAVLEGRVVGRGTSGPSDVLLELTPIEKQADVETVIRNLLGRVRSGSATIDTVTFRHGGHRQRHEGDRHHPARGRRARGRGRSDAPATPSR